MVREQLQVRWIVIEDVLVFVMYNFIRTKWPTQQILHYYSVGMAAAHFGVCLAVTSASESFCSLLCCFYGVMGISAFS